MLKPPVHSLSLTRFQLFRFLTYKKKREKKVESNWNEEAVKEQDKIAEFFVHELSEFFAPLKCAEKEQKFSFSSQHNDVDNHDNGTKIFQTIATSQSVDGEEKSSICFLQFIAKMRGVVSAEMM